MKPDYAALEKLAVHLYNVPRHGFDMRSWSRIIAGRLLGKSHQKNNYKCGMAACIGGHAALIFPHRLKLIEDGEYNELSWGTGLNKRTSAEAFAAAFRISRWNAFDLTKSYAAHQTPKAAARAIRTLIKRLKKERGDK